MDPVGKVAHVSADEVGLALPGWGALASEGLANQVIGFTMIDHFGCESHAAR